MMSRRGVAYTMVAVVLLAVIATLFFTQARVGSRDRAEPEHARIKTLDTFIKDIDADSRRAARIAGFRAMIAMEQHVTSSGEYFDDPDDAFLQIFLTGDYDGTSFTIMDNSSFSDYLLKVQQSAGRQGIIVTANVSGLGTWQEDPWHVLVNYTLDVNLSDTRETANWSTTRTFTGRVPVTDLRDPLFTKETLGRVQRVIKQSNVTRMVNDDADANDTTGIIEHFNNSFYVASGRGPSVLMRFAGNLSDSEFGIESLVDTTEFTAQGLTVHSAYTVVDYLYYTNTSADACAIQNIPSHIKLDNTSAVMYGVEGNLTYTSC